MTEPEPGTHPNPLVKRVRLEPGFGGFLWRHRCGSPDGVTVRRGPVEELSKAPLVLGVREKYTPKLVRPGLLLVVNLKESFQHLPQGARVVDLFASKLI